MSRSQASLESTVTEIIEGPIAATDRVYAFDKIRQVYPRAPSAVRRARARLSAQPHPTGSWPATAECTLVLEDGVIVSAGAIGSSVRDAIDELTTRLRRRLAAPAPSVRHAHGALTRQAAAAPLDSRIRLRTTGASYTTAVTDRPWEMDSGPLARCRAGM
jgi:ribosome-associated translation inhibitor RaiA